MYSNGRQNIPNLFKEIMANDAARDTLRAQPVIDFAEGKRLVREKRDFRRAAEKMLHWNVDKGNAA